MTLTLQMGRPLPQEVGDALLVYGERARPHVPTPHVFLTITAPVRPLSAKAVSQIAARALHRAHVASPSCGAISFMPVSINSGHFPSDARG